MGHPGWGRIVLSWHVRHLNGPLGGVLLCCSECQVLAGPASLLFSYQCWEGGEREATVMAPPTRWYSEVSLCFHGYLAFLHRRFPPQCPPSHPCSLSLSAVNSSSCSGIAPQFPCSSSQPLHLLGDLHSCLGYVWLQQGLSDSHSI